MENRPAINALYPSRRSYTRHAPYGSQSVKSIVQNIEGRHSTGRSASRLLRALDAGAIGTARTMQCAGGNAQCQRGNDRHRIAQRV